MKNKEFRECTECKSFVWCESPKQFFHKSTGIPCEEFDEAQAFKEQREKIAALIGDACERAAELELPAEELNSFVAAWLLREGMLLPPSVDVVPKSEVDKTIAEFAHLHADALNKFENARAEVAREIFEEIEKILSSYKILPIQPMDFQIISLNDLAELKKKYTEGEKC